MKKILSCRRSSLALISMIFLSILGYLKGADVSMAISAVVASVAAANSYEKSKAKDEV